MELGLYEWSYIVLEIFGTYIIYKFMGVFFDTRKTSREIEFVTYTIYYTLGTALFLYVNIPFAFLIFHLIALVALSYNYEATVRKRTLSALFILLIHAGVETAVGIVFGYSDFSLELFAINHYSSIYPIITCRIISFAIALILNNFKNIKKGESVPHSYWLSIALIPVASLYIILLLFQAKGIAVAQVMAGVVLILLINFATFYLYDVVTAALSDKLRGLLLLEQNKYYDRQLETIKSSLYATGAIRHDLKNHMVSIRALVETGETKEALSYVARIMDDIGARRDHSDSGNMVVDSIINFKFQEAEQRGIKVSLELSIPEHLEIPSFDMTILLGNLLDNALKAADRVSGERFIHLQVKYDKGRLMIQTRNPYAGEIVEEGGRLLTTEEDQEGHGIGLQNVKKVMEKYNGIMDIDYRNHIFSVSLMLYVN